MGLAEAILLSGDVVNVEADVRPEDFVPRARSLVEYALELDPDLSDGHRVLGYVLWDHEYDYLGAEAAARTATQLDPGSAEAWGYFGLALTALGRHDDAVSAHQRAVELEPAVPWILTDFGWSLAIARRYAESLDAARTALNLDPAWAPGSLLAADALVLLGRADEAVPMYEEGQAGYAHPWALARLGRGYGAAGDRAGALEVFRRLVSLGEERYVQPRAWANIYLALDSIDTAMEWLMEGARTRDPQTLLEVRHPFSDGIRTHERYPELLDLLNSGADR